MQATEETAQRVHDRLMPEGTEAEDPESDEAGINMAGWAPCLAPLRSQEACHIGPHRKSHKTPCRSCPPNRPCPRRSSSVWALMLGPMMTKEELQKRRGGHRLLGDTPREVEPVQNRSQTWRDRDGVWHNWRTSETASESASTRTRNAQQTWNQTGQDWRRDRLQLARLAS